MTADELFAAFSKDMLAVCEKHFPEGTMVAIAFAPPVDQEVRFVMNVPRQTGIALFEQAADLARSEMELPFKVVNPEKIIGFAEAMIKEYPHVRIKGERITTHQVEQLIYQAIESTGGSIEKALQHVRSQLQEARNS